MEETNIRSLTEETIIPFAEGASALGLSISQAAHALGVSLGTIRRWTDMGYIESYRTPGGQRRFSRDQIDRFIDSLQHTTRRAERLAS